MRTLFRWQLLTGKQGPDGNRLYLIHYDLSENNLKSNTRYFCNMKLTLKELMLLALLFAVANSEVNVGKFHLSKVRNKSIGMAY